MPEKILENFQIKILELVESGELKKGDLVNLNVQHNEWCKRLNGTGACNCNPEIRVYKSETVEDWADTFRALQNSYRKH